MYKVLCNLLVLCFINTTSLNSQAEIVAETAEKTESSLVKGVHIGIVQIIMGLNKGEVTYFDKNNFYSIGLPVGISFSTKGKCVFDLEFVPVIKPYINSSHPYDVHLLFHPGILFPLNHGWTLGLRLAFETGQGQFGFTPLLNKAFKIKNNVVFFMELVAPARFGPDKNSGYTQLAGLHLGIGF